MIHPCGPDCLLHAAAHEIIELIALAVVAHLRECQHPQVAERLIHPNEAAKLLGMSRRSLDRQHHSLPFCKDRIGGRGYSVVLSQMEDWIKQH